MTADAVAQAQATDKVEVKGKTRGGRASRFCSQMYKTEMCRFQTQPKGCRKGGTCVFAHHESEIVGRPDLAKTSICTRWEQGECPHPAEKCKFAHGEEDRRFTPPYQEIFAKKESAKKDEQESESTGSDRDSAAAGSTHGDSHGEAQSTDNPKVETVVRMASKSLSSDSGSTRLDHFSSWSGDEVSSSADSPRAEPEFAELPLGFGFETDDEDFMPQPRSVRVPHEQVAASSIAACSPGPFALGPPPLRVGLPVSGVQQAQVCVPAPTPVRGLQQVSSRSLEGGHVPRVMMQELLGPDFGRLVYSADADFVTVSGNVMLAHHLHLAMPELYED